MIEFREPLLLLMGLLAIPLFVLMNRPAGRMKFSSFDVWPVKKRSFRSATSFVPSLLLSLGLVSMSVALAGPRIPGGEVEEHREGISMMIVVDKSGSMEALDMSPAENVEQNRLDAVKDVVSDFVNGNGSTLSGRRDDSIGLISFASFPDSDCPLTLDHITLMQLVKDLDIADDNESGTAIGDALGLAGERLKEAKSKSKVIILLTDGVNNTGYEAPLDAARMVASLGIKVYTIGIGTNGSAPMRVKSFFGSTIRQVPVQIDEKTLTQIAEMTGGSYFRATDRKGLEDIYKKIDAMEKTKIIENRYLHSDEKLEFWVVLAMLLAASGLLLRLTYYRRVPL